MVNIEGSKASLTITHPKIDLTRGQLAVLPIPYLNQSSINGTAMTIVGRNYYETPWQTDSA